MTEVSSIHDHPEQWVTYCTTMANEELIKAARHMEATERWIVLGLGENMPEEVKQKLEAIRDHLQEYLT